MTRTTEASTGPQVITWREGWQRLGAKSKRLIPFATGVAAALLGVALYGAFNPPAESLTLTQVNAAVAEALAAATAPAHSALGIA
jgi:hypothetical protein